MDWEFPDRWVDGLSSAISTRHCSINWAPDALVPVGPSRPRTTVGTSAGTWGWAASICSSHGEGVTVLIWRNGLAQHSTDGIAVRLLRLAVATGQQRSTRRDPTRSVRRMLYRRRPPGT